MFIDEVTITVKGGHGGHGKVSFNPGQRGGPNGGNGGKGGNVYFTTTSDLTVLNYYTHQSHFEAENGAPGEGNKRTGADGKDLILKVPVGTTIKNVFTGEEQELNSLNETVLISKGGIGGRGNFEFKSSTNTTPKFAQPGRDGDLKTLFLNLRLIAQFGFIGLPNAGKSSLLNTITAAQAKVGDYPFTTLEPNLGSFEGKIIADIPGLIEGAHEGKGLGVKFLKHIEKVQLLLHCISAESEDVVSTYHTVRNELKQFNSSLLKKEEVIILTKIDLQDEKVLEKQKKALKKLCPTVFAISLYDETMLTPLKDFLRNK